jgi:hypothetical protein
MSNNITNWVNVKPFDVEVLLLRLKLKKNHNICCGFLVILSLIRIQSSLYQY